MVKIREETGLSFDDVLLVPHRGKVKSRDDVLLSTHLGGNSWLSIPIVASPMSTVCEARLARRLSELGGVGFIHRFMPIEDQVNQYKEATEIDKSGSKVSGETYFSPTHWAGCAIGISEGTKSKKKFGTFERLIRLFESGCRLFILDTAHGHSELVSGFMGNIPNDILHHSTFISGSVATADGARFAAEMGFQTIRVGIGNGSACSTREQTGHGVPQLTAIMETAEAVKGVKAKNGLPIKILACGGIRNGSDAVKALAAGASTVMLGQYLAGCDEAPSPGQYQGQASKEAKDAAGYEDEYIEGQSGKVRLTGKLSETIQPLLSGIRSGISYSGATSIPTLHKVAEFIVTAPGVQRESEVRI